MIKKIIASSVLAASVVSASDYAYEISPMIGYNWNSTHKEGHIDYPLTSTGGVHNHNFYGLEAQFNNIFDTIKPEISVLYGRDKAEGENGKFTGVLTTLVNGVYEFGTFGNGTPFVKAGAGYQWYTNTHSKSYDGIVLDAGLGLKAKITDAIALKLEALYMHKFNRHKETENHARVHNVAALAGLSFAFGANAAPVAPVVVAEPEVKAEPQPEAKPEPQPEPAVAVVPAAAPMLDSDGDGVYDVYDKCPDTPKGFKVDKDGCPIKATLHLNFNFDKTTITDADGIEKVDNFANFLKASPAYKANIVGHTDSIGKAAYNQTLSEKRAVVVKDMLVDRGVDASRLTTSGKGASEPVATNKTKEGRAENRRIDVDLNN